MAQINSSQSTAPSLRPHTSTGASQHIITLSPGEIGCSPLAIMCEKLASADKSADGTRKRKRQKKKKKNQKNYRKEAIASFMKKTRPSYSTS